MAIDLRDGDGAGRRTPSGPRPTLFHDNDRIWLANLADVPALDVRLEVHADTADHHRELLAELASRTLSAYEQRCVPAPGLPPAGVGLTLRWRDHVDGEHRTVYRVDPRRVVEVEGPVAISAEADRQERLDHQDRPDLLSAR